MNKKLFASAIFAIGALVSSTTALAANSYNNSVVTNANQGGNAVAAPGGNAVRGNDLSIQSGADKDMPKDSEVIIRLPVGLNFDGNPSYKVTPSSATLGLTLKDGTTFGDPTLDNPGISLFDTDGDGGMDRALVTVKADSRAGDTLTVSVNVKATSSATKGVKNASIIVNGGLAVTQPVVEVLEALAEPAQSVGTLSTASQAAAANVGTLTSTFIVTIPKGTAGSSTVTFKPQSKLKFASAGSTITYTVLTPYSYNPLKEASGSVAPLSSATSVNLTVSGTTSVTLSDDVQIKVTVAAVDLEAGGSTGKRGLDLSGAVTGSVSLVDVKANGSTVEVTKTTPAQKIPSLVIGSSSAQDLPTFTLTENFDGDLAAVGTSPTITITPNAGLVFDVSAKSPTLSGMVGTVTASASAMTITITTNPAASSTITIANLQGKASSTASGDLSIKVGTPDKNGNTKYVPNGVNVTLATATALGTVEVTGPKTLKDTGPNGATLTNTVSLKESTYGAITRKDKTQVQEAYIKVTPSTNGEITAVNLSTSGYPSGGSPTFAACAKETNSTDGSYICIVNSESTSVTAGTSTVSVAVDIKAKKDAEIGSTLDVTLSGNAGVSGSATLANVGLSTTASKGVVPDLTPGDTEASSIASVTIKENFTGAITVGKSFRLVAPSGVAFQDAAAVQAQTAVGTATITATFNPNDTLIIQPNTTGITFTAKAVLSSSTSGWLSFNLIDGDIEGKNGAGITGESIMLAYADGTLGAVKAGDDKSVTVGFTTSNAVTGGLTAYTAKSSDDKVATAEIVGSNVVVKGVAVGNATITVTDQLGGSDSLVVTVAAGATQPAAEKVSTVGGDAAGAGFTAGASTDGGATYATEFTSSDDVTLVATVNVASGDQGTDGEIHVAILSVDAEGNATLAYLDEDGGFPTWDQSIEGLGAAQVATPLAASHTVTIYSGKLAVGTHRIAVAYSTSGGKLVFTPKAMVITVTE